MSFLLHGLQVTNKLASAFIFLQYNKTVEVKEEDASKTDIAYIVSFTRQMQDIVGRAFASYVSTSNM